MRAAQASLALHSRRYQALAATRYKTHSSLLKEQTETCFILATSIATCKRPFLSPVITLLPHTHFETREVENVGLEVGM